MTTEKNSTASVKRMCVIQYARQHRESTANALFTKLRELWVDVDFHHVVRLNDEFMLPNVVFYASSGGSAPYRRQALTKLLKPGSKQLFEFNEQHFHISRYFILVSMFWKLNDIYIYICVPEYIQQKILIACYIRSFLNLLFVCYTPYHVSCTFPVSKSVDECILYQHNTSSMLCGNVQNFRYITHKGICIH